MAGLTLVAYESLIESNVLYGRNFIDDLTANHDGYTHTINAVGGFDSASFRLGGTRDYLDDWFNDGLMRRVVLYNPEAIAVWEGFASSLSLNSGTQKKTKSVDNLINRIYMRYSPLDTSVSPPLELPARTDIYNDVDSQALYGIKAHVISGGGRTAASAFNWATTVLRERKDVKIGEDVNTSSGDAYSLQVDCLGYHHALKWIPYISAIAGSIQSHQVIQEILAYFNTINGGWISQNFGLMDYNFATSRRGYNDLTSCWDIIFGSNGIIQNGGLSGERWVGGLYQNRQMVYKAAETIDGLYADEFELYRSLEDSGQFIFDAAAGTEVKPWDMLPDRVLHTADVNVGGNRDLMYIEQVRYTEPYTVELVGGDDQRLEVFLSRKGLPGI